MLTKMEFQLLQFEETKRYAELINQHEQIRAHRYQIHARGSHTIVFHARSLRMGSVFDPDWHLDRHRAFHHQEDRMKTTPHNSRDWVALIDPDNEKDVLGYSYAIAGASFAAILALACLSDVSGCLRWSLSFFSFSFPAAIAHSIFLRHVLKGEWSTRSSRILSLVVGSLVYLSSAAGVALLCFHISGIAGAAFLAASVLGVVFSWSFADKHGNTCDRLSEHYGLENLGPLPPLDNKEE
jgi:hypothetical protein